jgi:hypothetical protein
MHGQFIQTYIIAELISRIALTEERIGAYCSHILRNRGIIAKTTNGTLFLPVKLLQKQSEEPNLITADEIFAVISSFNA